MSYYLTLLKLREIASHKPIEIIQKSRVYLRPGEKPPKGITVLRGPNGGVYYDTRSHSPKHAYDEIDIAETYSELDNTAAFAKQYILDEIGQTKEAYTHIRNIERSSPKVKAILENSEGKPVHQVRQDINKVFKDLNESDMGHGWTFPSMVIGSLSKPRGRREHLKDPRDLTHKNAFKQLVNGPNKKNIPGKNRYRERIVRAIERGYVDKFSRGTKYTTMSSKTTKGHRSPRKRKGWKREDFHTS